MILTGIVLFSFMPVLAYPIGLYAIYHGTNRWKLYIFFMAVFLSTVAYSFNPTGDPDLVRYFDWIEKVSKLSFSDAVIYDWSGNDTGVFIFNIICWIIGKIGDKHLLPALSVFVIYYIAYYVTMIVAKSEGVSSKYAALYIIFCTLTLNLYSLSNNIRNILAFALVGFAVFRDIFQKKRDFFTLLLYIVPIFIHHTSILLIGVRLLLVLTGKLKYIVGLSALFVLPITSYLYENIYLVRKIKVLSILYPVIYSSYWYFRNENSEWARTVANSRSMLLSKIIYIFATISILTFLIFHKKNKRKNDEYANSNLKKFDDFIFYIGLITIACIPMPMGEYWRFAHTLIVFSGTFMVRVLDFEKGAIRLLKYPFFAIAPICFLFSIRSFMYGCDFGQLFLGSFTNIPIVVVLKDIIRFMM